MLDDVERGTKTRFKTVRLKVIRNELKFIIFVNGGFGLLQMSPRNIRLF